MRRPPTRANYLQIANVKGFLDRHRAEGGTLVCQATDPQPTGAAAGGVQLQRCSVAGLDDEPDAGSVWSLTGRPGNRAAWR